MSAWAEGGRDARAGGDESPRARRRDRRPLAGIGIWYAVDRWTGHPGLALGVAAGVIYVSARLTRALASATSVGKEMGAISITLIVVGVPYAVLLLIGVPAIVALLIGIILGPRFTSAVERRISLIGASARPN